MSGKYALIIGNTEYIDSGLAELTAPGKDAEDFARVLKDKEICAFDEVNVLLNQPEYMVRGTIDEFFDQKKPDDLLLLYFSGHGVRDELGSLYLAVKNTIRTRLRSTAIKSDYIREAMDQSRSKRQVLILDCCNSGAFSQGTKAATGVSIGTATEFEAGYGRIILTASDSTQFAWEGNKVIGETDNSLFTHFLVKGLEGEADLDGDGSITVDELYDYTYERVKLATPKQTPSKFSSRQQGEIILRQITRITDIKPVPLPQELTDAMENTLPFIREAAVKQLESLFKGRNLGLARSAEEALRRIKANDDSNRIRESAAQALGSARAEAERKAREEAERIAILKAQEELLAREKTETERLLAEQRTEKQRIAEKKRLTEGGEEIDGSRTEREVPEKKALPKHDLQQPVLKWTIVGIIGLIVLATGAWGLSSYLANLGIAPTPFSVTETPTSEIFVSETPATQAPGVTVPLATPPFTIGVSNPFISSDYREQMIADLIAVNQEYMNEGLTTELVVESADTDIAGQIQQLQNLIAQNVDAILVNPGDVTALNAVLQEAMDHNIIVISVDQELNVPGIYTVGIDHKEWAETSARWLADKLGGQGNLVEIEGFPGHPTNVIRMEGVDQVFAEYPGIKVLAKDTGKWDENTARQVMSNFLSAYPNINGYWTQDAMAIGALRAVMAANPAKWPQGVGEGRCQYLKLWQEALAINPDFDSIAVANQPGIAATGLRIAINLFQGKEVNTSNLSGKNKMSFILPISAVITSDNLEEGLAIYQGKPDAYLLDNILTDDEVVNNYFK